MNNSFGNPGSLACSSNNGSTPWKPKFTARVRSIFAADYRARPPNDTFVRNQIIIKRKQITRPKERASAAMATGTGDENARIKMLKNRTGRRETSDVKIKILEIPRTVSRVSERAVGSSRDLSRPRPFDNPRSVPVSSRVQVITPFALLPWNARCIKNRLSVLIHRAGTSFAVTFYRIVWLLSIGCQKDI